MPVTVRFATQADIDALIRLNEELFASDRAYDQLLDPSWSRSEECLAFFRERITMPDKTCLVAEVNGIIVAYANGMKLKESWRSCITCELDNIVVSEEFRDKGIGTMLLEAFYSWARGQGAACVRVIAYTDNVSGGEFYMKHGFKPQSTIYKVEL